MNTSTNAVTSQDVVNNLMIEMLTGAKTVGSDIYTAGKSGIIKAVDYAQAHAGTVVSQFLTWHFADASISALVSLLVMIFCGYVIYQLGKLLSKATETSEQEGCIMFIAFTVVILLVTMSIGFVPNVKKAIKIKVAPSVYLIEWTMEQVKK